MICGQKKKEKLKLRIVLFYFRTNLLYPQRGGSSSSGAAPCFYGSPEGTNQTLTLEMALLIFRHHRGQRDEGPSARYYEGL